MYVCMRLAEVICICMYVCMRLAEVGTHREGAVHVPVDHLQGVGATEVAVEAGVRIVNLGLGVGVG